jgi:hypothetical protein
MCRINTSRTVTVTVTVTVTSIGTGRVRVHRRCNWDQGSSQLSLLNRGCIRLHRRTHRLSRLDSTLNPGGRLTASQGHRSTRSLALLVNLTTRIWAIATATQTPCLIRARRIGLESLIRRPEVRGWPRACTPSPRSRGARRVSGGCPVPVLHRVLHRVQEVLVGGRMRTRGMDKPSGGGTPTWASVRTIRDRDRGRDRVMAV